MIENSPSSQVSFLPSFLSFFHCWGSTKVLVHARQVLYHSGMSQASLCLCCHHSMLMFPGVWVAISYLALVFQGHCFNSSQYGVIPVVPWVQLFILP
jgi:hypothetical protein